MSKLDRLVWAAERVYNIGETRISVRTTSARFGEWLDHALKDYETDSAEELWFDDYSLVVPSYDGSNGRREFCVLYRGSSPLIRTLDPVTFGRALVEELESNLYPGRDDAVYLQAFAIEVDGAYVLVPSFLAPPLGRFQRKLDRSGVQLARSTHVVLTDSGETASPETLLTLPADAFARLAEFTPAPITPDRFTYSGGRRVEAIFIHDETEAELHQISLGQATHTLAAAVVNLRTIPETALERVAQLVADSRCYGLGWTDARTTLDAILIGARSSMPVSSVDSHRRS